MNQSCDWNEFFATNKNLHRYTSGVIEAVKHFDVTGPFNKLSSNAFHKFLNLFIKIIDGAPINPCIESLFEPKTLDLLSCFSSYYMKLLRNPLPKAHRGI